MCAREIWAFSRKPSRSLRPGSICESNNEVIDCSEFDFKLQMCYVEALGIQTSLPSFKLAILPLLARWKWPKITIA